MLRNRRTVRINLNRTTYNDSQAVLSEHGRDLNGFIKGVIKTVADWHSIKRAWGEWLAMVGVQLFECAFVSVYFMDTFSSNARLRDLALVLVYLFCKVTWVMWNADNARPGHIKWYQWL